jgi:hypothetical protein
LEHGDGHGGEQGCGCRTDESGVGTVHEGPVSGGLYGTTGMEGHRERAASPLGQGGREAGQEEVRLVDACEHAADHRDPEGSSDLA